MSVNGLFDDIGQLAYKAHAFMPIHWPEVHLDNGTTFQILRLQQSLCNHSASKLSKQILIILFYILITARNILVYLISWNSVNRKYLKWCDKELLEKILWKIHLDIQAFYIIKIDERRVTPRMKITL